MLVSIPQPSVADAHVPSRYDNPFSTCWTRPGALGFRFADGQTADGLIAKLAAQNWRGAIVGPHGSGKSTLLEALKPALAAAGREIVAIALHDGQRRLTRDFFSHSSLCGTAARSQIIIDGYEQLSWPQRLRLAGRCRRLGGGLLVTAHAMTSIPTLLRLAPDPALIEHLVAELCSKVSTSITSQDVAASHACHGSNVREIFFDLYDRHERRRRAVRTGICAAT